ncbi:MAG: DEAD/DEAH box helicase [Myxococcota bacterium]
MLVLHGFWSEDRRLNLWAEDSDRPAVVDQEGEHPFAAEHWLLWDVVADLSLVGLGALREGHRDLLLPSSEDGPQASPGLLRTEDVAGPHGRLAPWRVPTVSLSGPAALRVVRQTDRDLVGLAYADEMRLWKRLSFMAEEFVTAAKTLPGLEKVGGAYHAVWTPVPGALDDFARLEAFRQALPAVARAALDESRGDAPPEYGWAGARGQPSHEVIEAAFGALVDAATRERLLSRNIAPKGLNDAHHRWLEALCDDDPIVMAEERALEALRRDLDGWSRAVLEEGQRPVRLCFRLAPPEEGDFREGDAEGVQVATGSWSLSFLLQSRRDPSLMMDAEAVWSEGGDGAGLREQLEHPTEVLLEELGRALTLYPELEEALEQPEPTGLDLSAEEAFEFLQDYAQLLEKSGYGIVIPSWWDKPERGLAARAKASADRSPSHGEFGVEALCTFDWEVALGDESLSVEELERLAELKIPLVRMKGEWVALRSEDIEKAIQLLTSDAGELTVAEAVRAGLGVDDATGGLPVVDRSFDGWLGELFDGDLQERIEATETPESFDGTLRAYQSRGLAWLGYLEDLGFGACLADDMGLGKTIQVLARIAQERAEDADSGATLVVAPVSVVGNWRREAERFVPGIEVYVHHGSGRVGGDALADAVAAHDLVITTYGVVRSDAEEMAKVQWHRVVLDEAQKIKNRQAGRTRAVQSLQAHRRVALTGTPVENRLMELWSIMQFLNPGLLGPAKRFDKEIARPVELGHREQTETLHKLTSPFILRRLKTDETIIEDLPEKVETREFCNLTEEQATLYSAAAEDVLEKLDASDGIQRQGLVLSLMTRLKQICNHPRQFLGDDSPIPDRSAKLARLEELAGEIVEAGDAALIFTQYTAMGEIIRHHLQERIGRRVLYLHGGTSQDKRDEMVEQFQADDGPPFFLLSLRAGGTGLTLTRANHVVHYDRWWNPAVEDQATDRAFRIGQTSNVQVHKLICEGTIEERIDAMIERKKELAERVLTSGEGWITELSTDELRDLVSLSGEVFE